MHALMAVGPEAVPGVVDVADPTPGQGQLSVRVELAGVNFADVMALRGDHGYAGDGSYVPGLEVVGTVDRLGDGVEGPHPGQRVTAYVPGGGFAEVAVVTPDMLVVLPDGIPSALAACVPVTLSTAHVLLEDVARVRRGDRLLVHSAAGGMGLALAALARWYDPVQLIGTVGGAQKRDVALDGGYDAVHVRDGELVAQVLDATAGRGVTAVFGALGTEGLAEDIAMTTPNGRIVRFGNAPGAQHDPLPPLGDLNAANVSIAGFSRRALARRDPSRVQASFRSMVAALEAGEVDLPVSEVAGLEALPAVLADMAVGNTSGKIVVRVAGRPKPALAAV
jgi:NADPH:quinone reductase